MESRGRAADERIFLVGLEHGAGLVIVHNYRPVLLDWNVGRQVQFVILAAVEWIPVRVQAGPGLRGSCADHGGCYACGEEEVEDVVVEAEDAGLFLELVATGERDSPCAVRIVVVLLSSSDFVSYCSGGGVANRDRLRQNRLHAVVWSEGLSLLDADGGKVSKPEIVQGAGRFLLHNLVKRLP